MTGNTSNTTNIVISGVGGQGVLTLAEVMAKAALAESYNVRVGEIHGMAQRGGHVVCTVRIGEHALGPIVDAGTADILIGFEPLETLREIEVIKKDGYVLMSSHVQYPVAVSMGKAEYPDHEKIRENINAFTKHVYEFDAMQLAKRAGSPRALNMVMFGAAIGTGVLGISRETATASIREAFSKRYESINEEALRLGIEAIVDK